MPYALELKNAALYYKKKPPESCRYPIITNVVATSAGLITWTTDIAATSQVLYGTNPFLGLQTTDDTTLVTSHSVQLTNLTNGSLYFFRVKSCANSVCSISTLYTFIPTTATNFIDLEDGSGDLFMEDGTKILLES